MPRQCWCDIDFLAFYHNTSIFLCITTQHIFSKNGPFLSQNITVFKKMPILSQISPFFQIAEIQDIYKSTRHMAKLAYKIDKT